MIKLPNVGLCDHSYLYHIVQNYHSLAPLTVFLPGSWNQGVKWLLTSWVMVWAAVFGRAALPDMPHWNLEAFDIQEWQSTDPANRSHSTDLLPAFPRPFGAWFAKNFPGEALGPVVYKGVFSATSQMIRKRPRQFYVNLLFQLDHHPRPAAAHMVERAWGSILDPA